MPVVAEEEDDSGRVVQVAASDLADFLDCTPSFLSRATHADWQCKGMEVRRYAVWENAEKKGRVSHYELPASVAVQVIPKEYHATYDL